MEPQKPVVPGLNRGLEFILAKNQPAYRPLPVLRFHDMGEGTVLSRWRFTWRERLRVLFVGDIYIQQMTFGELLQPILPTVEVPHLPFPVLVPPQED
jgi:hypothetical protein